MVGADNVRRVVIEVPEGLQAPQANLRRGLGSP